VAKTATLEVTSGQAEKIALGLQLGSVSLSLRSLAAENADGSEAVSGTVPTGEPDRSYTRDVDIYYMLDDSQAVDKADGEARKVQILRGGTVELVQF
jgi:Flp pilus assembly protein CpaB